MASALESFDKIPIWQRLMLFIVVAAAIVAVWFFVFYQEAVDARASAKTSAGQASAELDRVRAEKERFLERQREQAQTEAQLQKKMEVLPMTTASVDNLMQTFQQQARLVGLTVESWTPDPEQKEDFYARLPVKVRATGTWGQSGEFFRRVSELDRIVSVDNVEMKIRTATRDEDASGPPMLELEFEAATYRFLTGAERSAATDGGKNKKASRRRKK